MNIYVFDRRWPGTHRPTVFHSRGGLTAYFIVEPGTPIPNIVTRIRSYLTTDNIWLLRLCAHGNSGYLEMGEGVNQQNAHHFGALRGMFTRGGQGIQIHACAVASSDPIQCGWFRCTPGTVGGDQTGYSMLRALSDATGVSVVAGVNVQLADSGFAWEGDRMVVHPGGASEIR